MKTRTLILLACLCMLFALMTPTHAATSSTTFDLETYEDPDGCFSIDLPVGWEKTDSEDMLVFVRKGLAHFGLMTVDDGQDKTLDELMPLLLDGLKANVEEFVDMRTVEKPVVVSGGKTRIGHIKVAYKLEGKDDFVTDMYVIESKSNQARYAIVSYIPAAEDKDYRTLLEAVARSVVVIKQKVAAPATGSGETVVAGFTLKSYEDSQNGFNMRLPDGWTKESEDGMILAMSKGDAKFGMLEVGDQYTKYGAQDALRLILKDLLADTESFPRSKVLAEVEALPSEGGSLARASFRYYEEGELALCHIYTIADPGGKVKYMLMSYSPAADETDYGKLFDAMTRSITFADARKPAEAPGVEVRQTSVVKPGSIKPLYWIRNGTEIVKDGRTVFTEKSEIRSACASWDGKMIAYSRYTDIVLLDLSTGKRTQLYKVAGKTTVQYKEGGNDSETVYPVGFSPDNKGLCFIYQKSATFVGGNKLMAISIAGGQPATIDTGIGSAAVSRNGDMLVYKPGAVQFIGKDDATWEVEPSIRSIYVNGCGFTLDGKPFYYSSDGIYIVDPKGSEVELKLGSTNIDGTPVVLGGQVVWSDGRRIMSNEGGTPKPTVIQGKNTRPFK